MGDKEKKTTNPLKVGIKYKIVGTNKKTPLPDNRVGSNPKMEGKKVPDGAFDSPF
jgi:hypothetical protein